VTRLEDRLSRDLRAQAEHITPSSVPPLRLATVPRRAARRPGHSRRAWAAPLAAAAVAATLVVGVFAATQLTRSPAARPAQGPDGLPPYYVYLPGAMRSVIVARTATGATLARLPAPRPYVAFSETGNCTQYVSSAGDRKFVIIAYGRGATAPIVPYLLQVTAGGTARLTAVHLPGQVGQDQNLCYALSPDGRRLAVAFSPQSGSGQTMIVQVITLATGRVRQWTYTDTDRGGAVTDLTWVTSRTLAYYIPWSAPEAPIEKTPPRQDTPGTYLLDTGAPGRSLLADSRRVTGQLFQVQLATPGGALLIGDHYVSRGAHVKGLYYRAVVAEVSARTGQIVRTFGVCRHACLNGAQTVLWSNRSGSRILVAEYGQHGQADVIGLLQPGGAFTPLRPQPHAIGEIPQIGF
jgi:hypothetical protein